MSTTLTPLLNLIKPDGQEQIRNWPWQNLINSMVLDNKVKVTAHTYTPVLTATTTNPVLGVNGEIFGRYLRISNNWIMPFVRFRFGTSGINVGEGSYIVSLPVAADPAFHTVDVFDNIGPFTARDNSSPTSQRNGSIDFQDAALNTVRFFYGLGVGDFVTDTTPFLWATNDRLAFSLLYKEAPIA